MKQSRYNSIKIIVWIKQICACYNFISKKEILSRWILIDIFIELFSIKSRKKLWIFNSFSSSYTLSWSFMFSTCKHITKDNKTIKTLCHFLCLQYVKHMVCWKEHSWWPWLKNIKHKPKILYFAKLVCMM